MPFTKALPVRAFVFFRRVAFAARFFLHAAPSVFLYRFFPVKLYDLWLPGFRMFTCQRELP